MPKLSPLQYALIVSVGVHLGLGTLKIVAPDQFDRLFQDTPLEVILVNARGERATYGSLADAASKIAPPAQPTLKDAKNFKLIGTSPKRLDTPLKVNGTAGFGIDVKRPNMVYASLERCPVFEGKVASFDATKAKAVPGVKDVVQISNGVAVIADNTWAAMEGRKALSIKWDEGPRANNSSAISPRLESTMNAIGPRTSGSPRKVCASCAIPSGARSR